MVPEPKEASRQCDEEAMFPSGPQRDNRRAGSRDKMQSASESQHRVPPYNQTLTFAVQEAWTDTESSACLSPIASNTTTEKGSSWNEKKAWFMTAQRGRISL